jgi:AcrR family transcriptional regulator
MSKGQDTRQKIIERAAPVFNTLGYAGASMNDLTRETGLQKGGIYNHFESKDALALAAFDYATGLVRERFQAALDATPKRTTPRLEAIIRVMCELVDDPVLKGGCPLLNTAVEADDTHPALRERAQAVMTEWRGLIIHIARKGIEYGDLQPETDPEALATILISAMEGAIMMSRLYGDTVHLERAADHLLTFIRSITRGEGT